MDKAKLIEKLKKARVLITDTTLSRAYPAYLSVEELDLILTSLTAPVPDGKEELPSIDDAGAIAIIIASNIKPKLNMQQEAFFIAGFQECIKYLTPKTPDAG